MTTYSLGNPIAVGRTAEIYAWQEGQVLKLFHNWFSLNAIEYEARVGRAVHKLGLPVPAIMGEIIQVNERNGLVYERVDGITMLQQFSSRPWRLVKYARLLAELQAKMHSNPAPGLPSQRERLTWKIQNAKPLSEQLKVQALSALSLLPDGDRLCHGDFHPDNILMTKNGPVIIDWIDSTSGSPMADIGRSILIMDHGVPPSVIAISGLFNYLRRRFLKVYLNRYFELCSERREQLSAWRPVIAAARLSEEIHEEEEYLLSIVKAAFPAYA
jgi:uncharacterized protein (TIGR02172 family)